MRACASLGTAASIALTSCVGAVVAAAAAHVACPLLLLAFDCSTPDDPPFRWLEPMSWMLPTAAVAGAAAGALLAWLRARGGGRPNASQQPMSAAEALAARDKGPWTDPR